MVRFIIFGMLLLHSTIFFAQSNYYDYSTAQKSNAFFDDFEDNRNGWSQWDNANNYIQINNGRFVYHSKDGNPKANFKTISYNSNRDWEIEMRIKYVYGEDNNSNGLVFGADNARDKRLLFAFSGNGHYIIYDFAEGKHKGEWTKSQFVNKNDYNLLTVRKVGEYYYFFMNKKYVHSMPYVSYGNKIGVHCNRNTRVEVDYLKVAYLEKETYKDVSDEKRVALVFGNSNYQGAAHLGANPINDARDIASTLKTLGFEVVMRTDANLTTMNNAIRQFGRQNRDADVALFYFAGHGMQLERVNYLLPVEVNINDKNDVSFECVSVNTVQKIMETSNFDRLNLIILDACRNNPFRKWQRGGESGLAGMTPPSGTLIAFATSPGSTASNGSGQNGLYTGELVKQLKRSQRIEDVFINTRIEVEKKSGGQQSPWELARLRGKYFLMR